MQQIVDLLSEEGIDFNRHPIVEPLRKYSKDYLKSKNLFLWVAFKFENETVYNLLFLDFAGFKWRFR